MYTFKIDYFFFLKVTSFCGNSLNKRLTLKQSQYIYIFTRPGVAGAVLQSALSFIDSVILFLPIFKTS